MATRPRVPYYGVVLFNEADQDWGAELIRIFSELAVLMAKNQMPADVALQWGDIAGGNYFEVTEAGIRVFGNLNLGGAVVVDASVPHGTAFPDPGVPRSWFYRDDSTTLFFTADGETWVAVAIVDADSVSLAGALMIDDMGSGPSDKGSIPVWVDEDEVLYVRPSATQGQTIVADEDETTGWRASTFAAGLGGESPGKGAILVGTDVGEADFLLQPGDAALVFLRRNDSADTGWEWVTASVALGTGLTTKGELRVASGSGTTAVLAAPDGANRVLVSDPSTATGLKWINQSDMGSVPGTAQTAAANVYAATHFS